MNTDYTFMDTNNNHFYYARWSEVGNSALLQRNDGISLNQALEIGLAEADSPHA